MRRGVCRGLLLLATATILTGAAAAQDPIQPIRPAQTPPGAIVQPLGPDAGAALRGYLTTLADNPRSLDALLGAGREALKMGDAEASLGFYARADEVSPRNARVKAGMASAFVQVGQPQAALRLFEEAASLGAPAAEFAADRGLAFDMVGDPARAQQEYVLAMRHRDEPELRRRMALSLAITGQRDAALRLIDAQLRRHDRAAWRTQAFVLALTGDAAGANRTAQNVLPAGTAQAMAPFLAQLATLGPSQKAMAVHFGQFPSNGGASAAAAPVTADPGALAFAMGGAPAATAPRTRTAAASPRNARRRPEQVRDSSDPYGLREPGRSSRRATQAASRTAQATPRQPPATPPPAPAPGRSAATEQRPVGIAEVQTRWAGSSYPSAQPPPAPPPSPPPAPTLQSQPQQPPVTTQSAATAAPPSQQADPLLPPAPTVQSPSQQPPLATEPRQTPVTTQSAATTAPSFQQAAPPPAPTRIASGNLALPVTISSISGPAQPPAALPSSTSSAAVPIQSSPVIASVNPSAEPPVQTPGAPAVGPAVGSSAAPGFSVEAQASQPAPAAQGARGTALGDIAALLNSLPPEERSAPTVPAAPPPRRTERVRTAQDRPSEPSATTRQRPAQPAHPSRHWVQIAGGANRAALPREFSRLRTLAPQQLGRRQAYTATARTTNRLLVGPFASDRAAQEFVNQLAGNNVAAFAWTSAAGQEIERLQTR